MQREIKPFNVTVEQIDDYQFTQKQIKAYEALKKAAKRCQESGLTLLAKQSVLNAYPSKFYLNDMMELAGYKTEKRIDAPALTGCNINDSGADDMEYIMDKYITE